MRYLTLLIITLLLASCKGSKFMHIYLRDNYERDKVSVKINHSRILNQKVTSQTHGLAKRLYWFSRKGVNTVEVVVNKKVSAKYEFDARGFKKDVYLTIDYLNIPGDTQEIYIEADTTGPMFY